MPMAFKFDFFPARAFPRSLEELDWAVRVGTTGISDTPAPFCHARGHSARQTTLVPRAGRCPPDRDYLERSAAKLGITILLRRALHAE